MEWYSFSRDSPFELVAYTDSDYAGATLDRKSTTGGCQFLGNRLISWQCKKQTMVATSTTEVEYVAAASCYLLTKVNYYCQANVNAVKRIWAPKLQLFSNSYQLRHCLRGGRDTKIPQSSGPPDKGSGPRCQDTILGDVNAQTRFEITSIQSIDPPLSRGYTLGSREDINPVIYTSCIEQFWATAKVQIVNGVRQIQALVDKKRVIVTESSIRRDLHLDDAEGKDFSGRITLLFATAMVQLVEEISEDSDNPTDSTLIPIIDQPSSSSQPKKDKPSKKVQRQEAEVSQDETEHEESVLDLQKAKDAQAKEIDSLRKRIQRLERRKISRPTGLKRLRKVDIDVSLVDETQERQDDDLIFDTGVLDDVEIHVEAKVDGKDEQSTKTDDSTAGEAIKAAKPKVVTTAATTTTTRPKEEVVVQKPSEFRVPQEIKPSSSKDKGKGIMIEPEVPLKRKDQIALDEQIARDIQAKLDAELLEEQKLARKQEEEANIALIESWENTQAMMEADRLLAERLQSKEREELTDEEKAKLMELMEKEEQAFCCTQAVTTAGDDSVVPTTNEEITLAQTLIQIKAAKPKVVTTAATTTTTTRPKDKGVVVQEPSEFRVPQEIKPSSSKDKGKGIMIEPEVPLKRKDQIALDEQIARDIQAKLDAELLEEQKLARKQEEEANIALIESWENTQAMMEADRLLAERLQSKEREELTDEEKAKLFMELMEKRRKHFAALRAQEKRNRPPTKAQKRTQMSTYLKHMAMGSQVQENKEKKEECREETAKGSRKKMLGRKRAVKEQQEESSKKQKVEEERESEEVEEDDEYKLHKEGMLVHYELIRADGSSKRYSSMIRMLQGIDREHLEALWRIVKGKYADTRPEDEFERVLYGDLRVMFEPDIKSDVWRMLQGYKVTTWKLIDSSGVHFVRFDNLYIFMLVERRYPLHQLPSPICSTRNFN
ncbi:putative ribonuclease H-like domain-containing protein [Tanacetum coccineum]|uniref:Ribonuclease H-like domain-containing protein n=1 Tax=Tanacetum coccineum TaxID=301880 RepID=A0ABQ5D3B4_9ASTR